GMVAVLLDRQAIKTAGKRAGDRIGGDAIGEATLVGGHDSIPRRHERALVHGVLHLSPVLGLLRLTRARRRPPPASGRTRRASTRSPPASAGAAAARWAGRRRRRASAPVSS